MSFRRIFYRIYPIFHKKAKKKCVFYDYAGWGLARISANGGDFGSNTLPENMPAGSWKTGFRGTLTN